MPAHRLDQKLAANIVGDANQAGERPICHLNAASFVEQQQAFLHTVENGVLLRLLFAGRLLLLLFERCEITLCEFLSVTKSPPPPEMQGGQCGEANDGQRAPHAITPSRPGPSPGLRPLSPDPMVLE